MSMTLSAVPATTKGLSLYDLEQELVALFDTDAMVPVEQRAEFEADLARAIGQSVDKRERVGQFIRFCQLQQANVDTEIERLRDRKARFGAAEEQLRRYVQHVLESLGADERGKPRKLEGRTITFSLCAKPATLEISDESAIPTQYKSATVTMPLALWRLVVDEMEALQGEQPAQVGLRQAHERANVSIDRRRVKTEIEAGVEVPGADLALGGYSLRVR